MVWKELKKEIFWEAKEGEIVEGKLINKEVEVGSNKSNLYSIETETGDIIKIWGSIRLDKLMELITIGNKLRIVCNKIKSLSGNRTFYDYSVYSWLSNNEEINNNDNGDI